MKRVPSFWWDFTPDTSHIILESDDSKFPILAKWRIENDASEIIEKIEDIISDLKAGRKSMKDVYKNERISN